MNSYANVDWSEHRFSVFTPRSAPLIPPLDSQSQTPSFRPLSRSLPLCFYHLSLEAHRLALPNAPCSCPPHAALTRGSLVSSQKCSLVVSRPVILKMVPDQQQHLRTCQSSSSWGYRQMDQKTWGMGPSKPGSKCSRERRCQLRAENHS